MIEIMYAKIPKLIDLYRNVLKLDRSDIASVFVIDIIVVDIGVDIAILWTDF